MLWYCVHMICRERWNEPDLSVTLLELYMIMNIFSVMEILFSNVQELWGSQMKWRKCKFTNYFLFFPAFDKGSIWAVGCLRPAGQCQRTAILQRNWLACPTGEEGKATREAEGREGK